MGVQGQQREFRVGVTRNVERFRGGLVSKAHILCVSLNSRLESNKEEEKATPDHKSESEVEAPSF